MALLNENYLRSLAKARSSRFNESNDSLLRKRAMDSAELSSFDIFLSYSYLDKELIDGIADYLEKMGYVVYVDWKQDGQLSRENVTKETAQVVRGRITQSKSLFFATTESALREFQKRATVPELLSTFKCNRIEDSRIVERLKPAVIDPFNDDQRFKPPGELLAEIRRA